MGLCRRRTVQQVSEFPAIGWSSPADPSDRGKAQPTAMLVDRLARVGSSWPLAILRILNMEYSSMALEAKTLTT
jgi:hypothetical protein